MRRVASSGYIKSITNFKAVILFPEFDINGIT